jgi:cytochrome c-type biogenesis protein CcmH/NrfG
MEYDKKSDYAHAISDYEMALKINPDNNASRELLEMAKANLK